MTRNGRSVEAIKRGALLGQLVRAGVDVSAVHAGGPVTRALWGSASVGYPDGKLRTLRLAAVRSKGIVLAGSAVGLRLVAGACLEGRTQRTGITARSVSYTHLTLPTNREV